MPVHFSILLIEPPGIDSEVLKVMLAPEKFRVESAENGIQAWNLIQEGDPPDLVVIDVDLPQKGSIRVGGIQLLQLINQKQGWREVPKIILTSTPDSDMLKKIPTDSIEAVIIKPYDPMRFMNEVYDSLSRQLERHINEVNQQHIQLAGMLHELIELTDQRTEKSLQYNKFKQFLAILELHFNLEEQFMSQHHFSMLIEHSKNHQLMLETVNIMFNDVMSGRHTLSREDLEQIKQAIFGDVNDDKDYIDFLQNIRLELMA
ncbi:MAG: response regulator [Candidatus Thiodiazotropha sp. (ex Lucinoma borealis)]|nr:response regulator [Candidatus Thiodiazotropha sp. (ex Lucinoma borealis)]